MFKNWVILGLAALGLGLGWTLGLQRNSAEETAVVDISEQTLPELQWQSLDGPTRKLTDWKGQVLIVNHWATWCEPCRKEIPLFMAFRQQYQQQGLELIGIAHDDEDEVRRYVDSMGMDYPQLLADLSQVNKWLASLGSNGSLPLTLVYDRAGQLRAKKLGLMSEAELQSAIEPLL